MITTFGFVAGASVVSLMGHFLSGDLRRDETR
jgi:hypothetical protein